MKKILLSTLVILCGLKAAHAQKLEKPDIDKIKSDTTWKTTEEKVFSHVTMGGGEVLYARAEKTSDYYLLVLRLDMVNGPTFFSVGESNVTNIKFTDNSILNLFPLGGDGSSRTKAFSGGTKTFALVYYILTKESMAQLLSKSISVIRIATDGAGNLDFEIKPNNSEVIKKEMALISTK